MKHDVMTLDEVQVPAPAQAVGESAAILSMIERAARDPNVDIDKFERLMAMSERVDAMREKAERRAAEVAFSAAVSAAKGEIEPITRNATGHNNKKYADFGAIARAIDPILARNGLSYRFKATQADKITVTCVLSHVAGHSEENTLSGIADTTGSKNAIQAIGSTLTYLQRYTLVLALGIASSNDDDGRASGGGDDGPINADQYAELLRVAETVGASEADEARLLRFFKIESLHELPAAKLAEAIGLIKQRGARK
jgi:hypothetical protein